MLGSQVYTTMPSSLGTVLKVVTMVTSPLAFSDDILVTLSRPGLESHLESWFVNNANVLSYTENCGRDWEHSLLQRTQAQFPAPMSGRSQPSVTPATRYRKASAVLSSHPHTRGTHRKHTHIHTQKQRK